MRQASNPKRVCFISSRSGFMDEAGILYMDWANGRVIDQLTKRIPGLHLAIFTEPTKKKQHDFVISIGEVYQLPTPFTMAGGIRNTYKIYNVLKRIEQDHDFLIIQLPFIGFLTLPFIRKPTIYHVCANVLTAARNPFKYSGVKLLIAKTVAAGIHRWLVFLFKKNRNQVIVNGDELGLLYREFNPLVVVSSSIFGYEIITNKDVVIRNSNEPFCMLFIGRPSLEKGFPTLLAAFMHLINSNQNVTLSLVGVTKAELLQIIDFPLPDSLMDRIQFHGFLSWGTQFKQLVKYSHCLLMCSVSEGTPRVVVEAMALGCPVIATRVGGMPSIVEHGVTGLLFEPEDVISLTDSIISLQVDETLRQQIIHQALVRVRGFTLEKFTETFVQALNNLNCQ
ncbi:MAG: glycosyltransferase family 4 protein [Cyclobacteriaceae bacterium]|nr:glycosyltransferase family 4 protein [Cyclobacteriaceae bacterium]